MHGKLSNHKEKILLIIGGGICMLMILWLLLSPYNGVLPYFKISKNLDNLRKENMALAKQNALLREEIDKLRHNSAYLEEVARKQHGLIKKNETIYDLRSKAKKH